MYRKTESVCMFLAGGTIYTAIELMWRGYSHWSMTIAGGACLLLIHRVTSLLKYRRGIAGFAAKCAVCAVGITAVEFIFGVVFNIILRLDVWDYSAVRGNILGQICPQYTAAWFALSAAALKLSDAISAFFRFIERRETVSTV